jgi:hypothetical protein
LANIHESVWVLLCTAFFFPGRASHLTEAISDPLSVYKFTFFASELFLKSIYYSFQGEFMKETT